MNSSYCSDAPMGGKEGGKMKLSYGCKIKIVLIGAIVSGFWGVTSICSSVEYIWMNKADMPTPRWFHSSAVVNGKIYVFGGATSDPDLSILPTVEEYDPVTNTWTRKADMPTPRGWLPPSIPVVNGKIYVVGGSGDGVEWYSSTVEEYDPVTGIWTRKADMPTGRYSLSTCAVGERIYAFGGLINDSPIQSTSRVEEYDSITDTWTRKTDMPSGLWALCANVVNGKIYAFGGRLSHSSIRNLYEYDPAVDTWTRKADMPLHTSHMASVLLGNKIIVVGGWVLSNQYPYTAVQVYDPETDIWTIEADVPFRKAVFSANVVNSRIYVIGGTDRPHPCPALSTVYEFGPLLDFNWDGIVDSSDMSILIDNWQTDNPLYDIAPLPFGDSIVDVQDMIELTEHLFEEISPVALIGHWKLDEDEGDIAYNSIGDNHGILSGNPTWQINNGQVAGALEFDGIDDYVGTEPILNPSERIFSVVAWIKGGAPDQAILSQVDGSNWLCISSVEGCLMTELRASGRGAPGPLLSQTSITDENWYRISLVWDGSNRYLYVDGEEVAKDATFLSGLESVEGSLYFGAGSTLTPDSFFSGLIDDVRIYNRAISP